MYQKSHSQPHAPCYTPELPQRDGQDRQQAGPPTGTNSAPKNSVPHAPNSSSPYRESKHASTRIGQPSHSLERERERSARQSSSRRCSRAREGGATVDSAETNQPWHVRATRARSREPRAAQENKYPVLPRERARARKTAWRAYTPAGQAERGKGEPAAAAELCVGNIQSWLSFSLSLSIRYLSLGISLSGYGVPGPFALSLSLPTPASHYSPIHLCAPGHAGSRRRRGGSLGRGRLLSNCPCADLN